MNQYALFGPDPKRRTRLYAGGITAIINRKGVLDVDSVKGCSLGMRAYPESGCYGDCYAARTARFRGFDFSVSVKRRFFDREHLATIRRIVATARATWYRVGVSGDPSHDWAHTVHVCKYLWPTGKIPVIVTKHWLKATDEQVKYLRHLGAIVHTSVSGMDSDTEIAERMSEHIRITKFGIKSMLRVVTCKFSGSEWGRICKEKQDFILSRGSVIDNPFRPSKNHPRVLSGEIVTEFRPDSAGGKMVSLCSSNSFLGKCGDCPDQCGAIATRHISPTSNTQHTLFKNERGSRG